MRAASSSRMCTVNGTQSTWQCPVWLLSSARPVRKRHAGAAGRQQLLAGLLEGMRFADDPPFKRGHLVRADNQMSRMAGGEGAGFLFGQALDQLDGRFIRAVAFVDIRRAAGERQVQAGSAIPDDKPSWMRVIKAACASPQGRPQNSSGATG